MNESFHQRYRYPLFAAVMCLAPLVTMGALKALGTNANDVRTWLPQGLPETTEYARFGRSFGSEEFVAISWDGCTLDDPRLPRLADRLAPRPEGNDATSESQLVESVLTGPQSLDALTAPPLNLSRDAAVARLRGLTIGPDGRQACAVVRPTERGKQDPHELLEKIYLAAEASGVPRDAVRMGGPPVTSAAIDEAAASSLRLPGLVSIAAAFLFSWFCFRSVRLTLLVITVGVFSAAAALAMVWFTGGVMNAVLLSMPPLVYVSTTSGAIHWANYYRDAVTEGGLAGASGRAVAHARLPLALATGTTAVGLLSLCGSDLLPIRQFGFYSALGVAAALAWLLVVLPAGCALWPLRSAGGPARPAPESTAVAKRWSWIQAGASRNGLVTIVGLALAALCGLGLLRVKTSVSAEEFFSQDAPFPQNSRWLEEHLGGMTPMELVLRMDSTCQLNMLQRMELVERVQRSVGSLDEVAASVSAVTFGPELPASGGGRREALKRSVFNKQLVRQRDRFVGAGFLASDGGDELWRISLRTRSFHNVDHRYFMDTVRQQVAPVLEAQRGQGAEGVSATFTGMVPLINRAQQSLLEGLTFGLVTDLVLIVATIVVLMRHWSVGLVMLITGVFPTLIVLGLMGWFGFALDIGTVLAPSVALGVTVDDVLHFVLWFRRGLAQGMDRREAVRLAYGGCARAMLQSWGVIGLGLSAFALSDFAPTQRFGLLMVLLLSVALVVNLVLLPALLAGPLGGSFARSVQAAKNRGQKSTTHVLAQPISG